MDFVRSVLLIFAAVLINHVISQDDYRLPTAELDCRTNGFQIALTYQKAKNDQYKQKNSWMIGDIANPGTDCKSQSEQEILDTSADSALDASPAIESYGTIASPACNGNFGSNSEANIVYKTKFFVKIKETVRQRSLRIYVYEWDLTCTLVRVTTAEDEIGYQVITQNSGLNREGNIANEDDTFSLDVIIQFIDSTGAVEDAVFSADNNDQVTFRVSEKNPSDDLKFTVQKCWASKTTDASDKADVDDFIENECGLDDTIAEMETTSNAEAYDFSVRAFYLEEGDAGQLSKPTYVHCEAFVCYTDEADDAWGGKCVQENLATCKARRGDKRKRRSIEPEVEELLRTHTETSQQAFVLRDVFSPRCPSEYVYDTLTEDCTKDRVMSIKGVHLDLTWRPAYANASSTEFKQFADITASRILSLLRATGKEGTIRGVKIMKAEENNGVTLDVLITHSENVNADEGFATFKDVLYKTTPRATRVVNLMNIGQEKLIELVPVVPVVVATEKKSGLNTEILIIIIVAAVLVVMVIFAVTLYRFRKVREQPTQAHTAYENNGMDKI